MDVASVFLCPDIVRITKLVYDVKISKRGVKAKMERYQEIERSIIKKYRKNIWLKFISSVIEYQLIQEHDKIAVCISGGKDSMLMAKLMQELQRHGKFHFDLEFLVMDPGYSPANRQMIEKNAGLLHIPIRIFETDIFNYVSEAEGSPCYLCARMRRGHLYKNAQLLGCNKIALGHHMDDVIETILMSVIYGAEMRTMMPKLHSKNFPGMQLIRPMYMVRESSIQAWQRYNGLEFLQCACRFTEQAASAFHESGSKRKEMKELIRGLEKKNSHVAMNIFRSAHKVNLDTIIGYYNKNKEINFLDQYDGPSNHK